MKIDLVMWAYNGAWVLPRCLASINREIPESVVNRRIMVDDNSTDRTREIGMKYGWKVVRNRGKGIEDGANTALDMVETERYASFEQDIVLHPRWWKTISKLIEKPKVAAAQGTRVPDKPVIRELQLYRLRHNPPVKSLDNTLYKTEVMRKIGGYTTREGTAVDTHVIRRVEAKGYQWLVDPTLISEHIRKGIRAEFRTYYWYSRSGGKGLHAAFPDYYNMLTFGFSVLYSLPLSVKMAIEMKCPQLVFVYPLIRMSSLKGFHDALRKKT